MELEKEAARETAKLIRNTGYRYAEDLVYGLSAMNDYDAWLLEKLSQLGLENWQTRSGIEDSKKPYSYQYIHATSSSRGYRLPQPSPNS